MAVRAGRRFTTELKCEAEKRAQQTGRTFCGLEGGCISPRSSERKPRRAPDISNTSTNKETVVEEFSSPGATGESGHAAASCGTRARQDSNPRPPGS